MNKRIAALALGIVVALTIISLPISGLEQQGKVFLALTMMTVIFWAFQVAQSGYIAVCTWHC